jgi:CheY-like chemotaxis protein
MRPKKVILCVDDNDQALSVRKFVLETRGYRVLTAKNAEEAIELYDRGRVDLVVTDLVMPHCNGNDLILQLKEIAPWVPAVLVSGSIKQFDPTTRADAFLPKGACSPQELLERIRVLLVRKRGPKKMTAPQPAHERLPIHEQVVA